MGAAQEVIKVAEDRASALAAGDAEGLHELLHAQFRWTTHLGQTSDRSEYIRRNTEGYTTWRSQALSDAQVVVVGDTAVLDAEVTDVVLSDNDEPRTLRMPMTQVWICLRGGWKCHAGHVGPRRRLAKALLVCHQLALRALTLREHPHEGELGRWCYCNGLNGA